MKPMQTSVPKDYLFKAYNPTSNQTQYFQTMSQLNSFTGSCCGVKTMGYVNKGSWNGWNITVKPY